MSAGPVSAGQVVRFLDPFGLVRPRQVLGFVVAMSLVVAACGIGDAGDSSSGSDRVAPGDLRELLGPVPDTEDNRSFVVVADLRLAAAQLGVERPASSSGVGAWKDYVFDGIAPLDARRPAVVLTSCWDGGRKVDERLRGELGVEPWAGESVVRAGTAGRCLLGGEFPAEVIEEAIESAPGNAALVEKGTYEGNSYLRWLADDREVGGRAEVGPLFPRSRLLVTDDWLLTASTDAEVEAVIDASTGENSLADNATFALLAEILTERGAHSAMLSDRVATGPEGLCGLGCPDVQLDAIRDRDTLLGGVEAWATGWGSPNGEEIGTVVAVAATEADAERNTERLEKMLRTLQSPVTRRRFSEDVSVVSAETVGRASVVQLKGVEHPAGRWLEHATHRREIPIVNAE